VILAAGKGVRMNSERPKVVHEVAGHPMVWWVVKAVREAGARPIILVVGHGGEEVRAVFDGDEEDLRFVVQERQLGTGHATAAAESALRDFHGDVLVLAGDGPLIRPRTISALRRGRRSRAWAGTLATATIDDPTGYGRIVRDSQDRFQAIVEHRNASEEQRAIREIYPSYACFDRDLLFEALRALRPDPLSGEYYLTEVPALLRSRGCDIEVVDAVPPEEVLSINTPQQLAEVDAILRSRLESQP
jgi:bifunctional UDP-N-acetylglucosamine pyrophosphorylase/glucosamine-1-phosphate N-acetyltransferase